MSKFVRKQKTNPKKSINKIPIAKNNNKLSPNEKIFADQWLMDRNGTQAYKIAYPHTKKDNTAAVLSFQLLKKPRVAEYIKKRLERISDKAEINVEWVLKKYKMLVEYSIADFFDDKGKIKPLSEIPKDKLYAVCGFKVNKIISAKDSEEIKTIIRELKFSDKKGALDSLAKHLGMFEKDNEQKNKLPIEINVRLTD